MFGLSSTRGKKIYCPRKGGFTLLEVMIAMAILAITLVVVFQSQSQSVSMKGSSKAMTTLTLLAQSKMAEFESAEFSRVESSSGEFGPDFPDYSWTCTVSTEEFLKKIVLTVKNNRLVKGNAVNLVLYRFKS